MYNMIYINIMICYVMTIPVVHAATSSIGKGPNQKKKNGSFNLSNQQLLCKWIIPDLCCPSCNNHAIPGPCGQGHPRTLILL